VKQDSYIISHPPTHITQEYQRSGMHCNDHCTT